MTYLGRYQQGEEVPIYLLCATAAHAPVAPDAAPLADVSGDGFAAAGLTLAVAEPDAAAGLFAALLFLDGRFAGRCAATLRWLVSGAPHARQVVFEVAPGSGPSGAVLSLHYYRRPHAEFLVQQRAGGGLYKGKGPRL